MGDRFEGSLAGGGKFTPLEVNAQEAMDTLCLYESLIAKDANGERFLLRALQNPFTGGIMLRKEDWTTLHPCMFAAIIRSQMTSMLADDDRCSKYTNAIRRTLLNKPAARVLDIGAGTGLLSMIAARSGAKHVDAIEMFESMAHLASKIIRTNGLESCVKVHAEKSTDLIVGTNLKERADILVTEIFDSALLGEGCLPVLEHAHAELLQEGASVVPAKAKVYGVLINSDFLVSFRNLGDQFPLHRSDNGALCKGGGVGIPMRFDTLRQGADYEIVSEEFDIFDFDFSREGLAKCKNREKTFRVKRVKEGVANVLLTWWELDLTGHGDIVYSSKAGAENWQDHWLPVIYPLAGCAGVAKDEAEIVICGAHDDMKFTFEHGTSCELYRMCTCGVHAACDGPYRIAELADYGRLESLKEDIAEGVLSILKNRKDNIHEPVRAIDVSDGGVCAVLASQVECNEGVHVASVDESNELATFIFSQIVHRKKFGNNEVHFEFDTLQRNIEGEEKEKKEDKNWKGYDMILTEPHYRAMRMYPIATLANIMVQRNALTGVMRKGFKMVPSVARVMAKLVRFPNGTMQKSYEKITEVQGFDHCDFAELMNENVGDGDEKGRISLPLFQYEVINMSKDTCIENVCISTFPQDMSHERRTTVQISDKASEGYAPAEMIALWVEYDNRKMLRMERYETIWLSDSEKICVEKEKQVTLQTSYDYDVGTWRISIVK